MSRPRLMLCLPLALGLCGCPANTEQQPLDQRRPAADLLPQIAVGAGASLLYTFFDERAEMKTVDRLDLVPSAAQAEVMVTDPRKRMPGDLIVVADLRRARENGTYRSWTEQRGAWLDRVMPKLSLLEQRQALARATPVKKAARPRVRKHRPRAKAVRRPKVLLFSTTWCPSCRTARQYFESRGVPFLELDVEKDPQAAQQYQEIARAAGLRAGAVPLIVINGRPLQGFSQPQVEAALATLPR